MQTKEIYLLGLPAVFIWIGFVCAISFMEAWLKFRAPGVTLPLGLGIGSVIFKALNKMEWIFALIIAVDMFLLHRPSINLPVYLISATILILVIQTFWLLPALDARIPLYQQGLEVPSSPLHHYYVAAELIKTICLFIVGIHFITYQSLTKY